MIDEANRFSRLSDAVFVADETVTTGIRKTVKWYLNNRTWCDHVKDGSYQGERLGVIK